MNKSRHRPRFESPTMIALVLFCVAAASANSVSRIVGGTDANKGDHPHQVSLLRLGSHSCGGSILNENWIVTAAHCTTESTNRYSVKINEYDRSSTDDNEETIGVAQIIQHKDYNKGQGTYPNDISLIRLSRSIRAPFTAIELQTTNDEVSSTCTITGWGATNGGEPLATILQKATGLTISTAECRSIWGSTSILASHICYNAPSTGACNGDSGGPMECTRESDGESVLVGVTSWGASGCLTSAPSVYTRISSYVDWINGIINA